MEIRRLHTDAQFRAANGTVNGHASVFGQVAKIGRGFEQIDKRAFDRAIREKHDVALLVNHDGMPLARTTNGTLQLSTDGTGLVVDADLADTTLGHDVRTLLERGDLTKMSFGFIPTGEHYEQVNGVEVRTITDLDLFDVSIVTFPAYGGTDVALRSWEHQDTTTPRPGSARGQAARIRARIELEG